MADSDSSKVQEATYQHQQVEKEEGLVEEVTTAAKSMIDDVAKQSSSYVTQVESLVSDPWAAAKSLTGGGDDEKLPPSDKNAGEASEATDKPRDLDETEKSANTDQPCGGVVAGSPASWKNCCGLLELLQLQHSDQ